MGLQIEELASFQSVQCCSRTISPIFYCFSAYTAESYDSTIPTCCLYMSKHPSSKTTGDAFIYTMQTQPPTRLVNIISSEGAMLIQMKFDILWQRQPAQARRTEQTNKHGLQHLHPSTGCDDSSNGRKDRSTDLTKDENKRYAR